MVNLKHIFTNRNCPTLESQLRSDIGMSMEDKEQKYGEFPPIDRLYEREEDPNVYKENPILRNLFEHYQPFFEKGINYTADGKTWNVYPTGRMLWYCNEAFSLCTKLSIDPCPEDYFIDEYYNEIGGGCTQIERYFVLSIVYALLAVNWKVRRQHLKMMDVLYNFLSKGCPYSIMIKCMEFITKTYTDNNAIDYEFRPVIDRWGYTLLKVDEGLIEDKEEQMELFTQMRTKVCKNGLKYGETFNLKPESNPSGNNKPGSNTPGNNKSGNNPPTELLTNDALPYWTKLREKGFVVADSYALMEGVSDNQAAYIAFRFSEKLGNKKIWKPFKELWGIQTLAQHAGNWKRTGDYPPRANEIDNIFGVKQEKPKGHVKLK
jgi:hypothetical protein